MDDLTTYALLAASFFFVALAFGLLLRYRQVSQKINSSTDMGRDLWGALEQRLKKQDERILDMMGRLEVIQSRVMAATVVHAPTASSRLPPISPPAPPMEEKPVPVTEPGPTPQQSESQPTSQKSQPPLTELELDETQLEAIKLLGEGPKDTRQLTDTLEKSREHTARLMKGLFDLGLVRRNDSTKPFVYQLTDEGRRYLST